MGASADDRGWGLVGGGPSRGRRTSPKRVTRPLLTWYERCGADDGVAPDEGAALNDVVRTAHVPTLTVATASLLSAGMLSSFSGDARWLVPWAFALVAAVAMFLAAGAPDAPASVLSAVAALLASAALWGALDAQPARVLAGFSAVLFLALATGAVFARASRLSAD